MADRYTHGHQNAVLESHRSRTAANSAAYLVPHLASGLRLLDVGCGPGTLTADLAELVDPGEVIALDREPEVLAEAESYLADRGIGNATCVIDDVYSLDFPDHAFDVVHAHQVLQHLTDPVAALREMRRVAKPGGIVAARDVDYAALAWSPRSGAWEQWQELYRAVAHANGAQPEAGPKLAGWAVEAGFSAVQPSESEWLFSTPERCAWWATMWADRFTKTAIGAQAVEMSIATSEELAAMGDGLIAWAQQEGAWFKAPHGEILAAP